MVLVQALYLVNILQFYSIEDPSYFLSKIFTLVTYYPTCTTHTVRYQLAYATTNTASNWSSEKLLGMFLKKSTTIQAQKKGQRAEMAKMVFNQYVSVTYDNCMKIRYLQRKCPTNGEIHVRMQPGITRQHFGLCQMAPAGGKIPARVSPNQMTDQTVYKRKA